MGVAFEIGETGELVPDWPMCTMTLVCPFLIKSFMTIHIQHLPSSSIFFVHPSTVYGAGLADALSYLVCPFPPTPSLSIADDEFVPTHSSKHSQIVFTHDSFRMPVSHSFTTTNSDNQ